MNVTVIKKIILTTIIIIVEGLYKTSVVFVTSHKNFSQYLEQRCPLSIIKTIGL